MTHQDIISSFQAQFGSDVLSTLEFRGEHTVTVTKSALEAALAHAKNTLSFDFLVDLTTIDHAGQEPRFEIAYELYSYTHGLSLRIKAATSEDEPEFPTATGLWEAANWHEREAYDMMGIRFTGHPDLRRILMWEGYPYFPLRKEFPLAGKPSEMPDVAFSDAAPLQGGPFVSAPGAGDAVSAEPRARG